jgi:DNA primase
LLDGAIRQPQGLTVRCPAHGDRTPSCSVTVGDDRTIRVRCFGCDLVGDVLSLVAAVERLDVRADFRAVLERAAEIVGYDMGRPTPRRAPPAPVPVPVPRIDFDAVARPILTLGRLDGTALAHDVAMYLDGRGLLDAARADGWAGLPTGRDTQAAWARVLRDALLAQVIEGLGLLKGDGWCWPGHLLVIPWRDPQGRVVTLQRRAIGALASNLPKYVFPSGGRPLWPYGVERLASLPADAPIAFVEGAVDVLAARELGLASVTGREGTVLGLPGVTTWREEWTALVTSRMVVLGVDVDKAGEAAAQRLAARLYAGGAVGVKRARPPRGAKDWADALGSNARAA